jgi:hypothetical protein
MVAAVAVNIAAATPNGVPHQARGVLAPHLAGIEKSVRSHDAVSERRQAGPDFGQAVRSRFADDDSRSLQLAVDDRRPRDRSACCCRASHGRSHAATLGHGQHVTLILDRPRPQQDFPVCPPGGLGEGGRNHQQVCDTERSIKLRKSEVVADRQADPPKRRAEGDRLTAGLDGRTLVVALVTLPEAEKVDLVVARDALALRIVRPGRN